MIKLRKNIILHIKGPFEITQVWTNGVATSQMGSTKVKYNIFRIKTYKYETNDDNFHP